MNMWKFNIIAFIIIAAVISSPPIVSAASYDKSSVETRRQELYKDLNLSEAQKKSLDENRKNRREEMRSIFSQMKEKREAVRNELQKDELNIGKITQINNELKILSAQMLDRKLDGILEVRKILTPGQFRKFMAKMDERQEQRFKEKRD